MPRPKKGASEKFRWEYESRTEKSVRLSLMHLATGRKAARFGFDLRQGGAVDVLCLVVKRDLTSFVEVFDLLVHLPGVNTDDVFLLQGIKDSLRRILNPQQKNHEMYMYVSPETQQLFISLVED